MLDYLRKLLRYRFTDPDRERIDSELRVARRIQFSLVPERFPSHSPLREFDIYSVLRPANEVGGDFYDFLMNDPDRLILAVGDVSGGGVPAALYMAVCRTAFRALAGSAADPADLMTRLNDMLVRDSHSGRYVTVACFFIDLPSGRAEFALAGHPPPLLYRRRPDTMEFIDAPRQSFAGMQPGLRFPLGEVRLAPGDTLLLYSDGVTDAQSPRRTDLGYAGLEERFRAFVGKASCRELVGSLDASIREFQGGQPRQDDISLLAFRFWGAGGSGKVT